MLKIIPLKPVCSAVWLLSSILFCLPLFAQEIYRWVDENGVTHFSQSPPPASEKLKQAAKRVVPEEERYRRFYKVDQHALDTPKAAARSIETLADYLKAGTGNELETARVIYRWMTQFIFYDAKGLLVRGQLGPQDAKSALRSRLVVCEGYARLYEALAKAAGLDAVTIIGYSKGYSSVPGEHFGQKSSYGQEYTINGKTYSGSEVKHAWNAVNISGQWHLIDTTWGAGYLDNRHYTRDFTDYYFLTPPKQFIYDHFPDQSRWQLLAKPLSLKKYEDMVALGASFFRHQLKIASHSSGVINTRAQTRLQIGAPKNVHMQAQLFTLEAKPQALGRIYTGVKRENEHYQIDAVAPAAGKYLLRIYAGAQPSQLHNVVNYTLNASAGLPQYALPMFPEQAFYDLDLSMGTFKNRFVPTKDTAIITLPKRQPLKLTASLQKNKRALSDDRVFVQQQRKAYEIRARVPEAGLYDLYIYAQSQTYSGSRLPMVLHYIIKASAGSDTVFPHTYTTFNTQKAYLHTPLEYVLKGEDQMLFTLTVPKAKAVAVRTGQRLIRLQRGAAGRFSRQISVPYGKFYIYAQFHKDQDYEGLLQFQGK